MTNQYIQNAQSKLFEDVGAFFCFSDKQFHEGKQEGVEYVHVGAGLIVPKDAVDDFLVRHKEIVSGGIAKDLKKNGVKAIIQRELSNHECYYTGDITDCVEALEDYGITEDQIWEVYRESEGV